MNYFSKILIIDFMKSSIVKIAIVIFSISLSACFDDPGTDIVWGDQAYIELDRAGQPNPTVNRTFNIADGDVQRYNVQVNIMGRPQPDDVSVTFEIEAGSTAVEGVHYNKITSGNTVVIPAGSNIANIEFDVLVSNIPTGTPAPMFSVIVNVTGGDLPLSKYVRATFNLRR
jgi:hypothetical protein